MRQDISLSFNSACQYSQRARTNWHRCAWFLSHDIPPVPHPGNHEYPPKQHQVRLPCKTPVNSRVKSPAPTPTLLPCWFRIGRCHIWRVKIKTSVLCPVQSHLRARSPLSAFHLSASGQFATRMESYLSLCCACAPGDPILTDYARNLGTCS